MIRYERGPKGDRWVYRVFENGKRVRVNSVLAELNKKEKRINELMDMLENFLYREEFKHIDPSTDSEVMQ